MNYHGPGSDCNSPRGEFVIELRHRCRNPRCRSKLPAPVSNPREAFCSRGCYNSYHLHRCLACEGVIERKREDQKVCRKARCRNAWRAGLGFGRYAVSSDAKLASKTPDFIDPKAPLKPDRAWRVVAGELTPTQLHCATIGGGEAVEAINRTNLRHWRECNAKAEGVVDLAPEPSEAQPPDPQFQSRLDAYRAQIPDDLSVPDFLRRTGGAR